MMAPSMDRSGGSGSVAPRIRSSVADSGGKQINRKRSSRYRFGGQVDCVSDQIAEGHGITPLTLSDVSLPIEVTSCSLLGKI